MEAITEKEKILLYDVIKLITKDLKDWHDWALNLYDENEKLKRQIELLKKKKPSS